MSNRPFIPNLGAHPATLREALENCYNADRLREFARALNIAGPTRKADLAAAITESMLDREGTRFLEDLYATVSDVDRAAVSEGVYDPHHLLDLGCFKAKYGSLPDWPSFERAGTNATLLGLFVMPSGPHVIPDDLATRLRAFVPPTTAAGRLEILPNLHIVPAGGDFEPRDETFLSTFCAQGTEGFGLDRTAVAAAAEKGHGISDFAAFLEDACEGGLPAGARAFFDDMEDRTAMLSITGHSEMGYPLLAGGDR
jgi:hypothetical protein